MSQNTPKTELLYKKSKPIDKLILSDGIALMTKEQMIKTFEDAFATNELYAYASVINIFVDGLTFFKSNCCSLLFICGA